MTVVHRYSADDFVAIVTMLEVPGPVDLFQPGYYASCPNLARLPEAVRIAYS